MRGADYVFEPGLPAGIPVAGMQKLFPVHRVYCVGRNYAAHAVEMGHDPDKEPPFFFQKNPDNLMADGRFPYPPASSDVHHEIEMLVARHTATVGRKAKAIRFRDTTSRWGSCTSDGTLSFSWRIMMAPPAVIDYLVAHEVAHLKEMNHGPDFWKLCGQLCPDTERCKAWLKRNGGALQAIRFE